MHWIIVLISYILVLCIESSFWFHTFWHSLLLGRAQKIFQPRNICTTQIHSCLNPLNIKLSIWAPIMSSKLSLFEETAYNKSVYSISKPLSTNRIKISKLFWAKSFRIPLQQTLRGFTKACKILRPLEILRCTKLNVKFCMKAVKFCELNFCVSILRHICKPLWIPLF